MSGHMSGHVFSSCTFSADEKRGGLIKALKSRTKLLKAGSRIANF